MFWRFFKKSKPVNTKATDSGSPEPEAVNPTSTAPLPPANVVRADIPVAFIKRLMPIAQLLVEEEIGQLVIQSADFMPGAIIFNRDTEDESLIYVTKGTVYLEAANGVGQEASADTLKAFYPLSSGKSHGITAIAKTHVTVIYVPKSVLQLNRYKLNIPEALKTNRFVQHFYTHLKRGDLEVPNFPDVALKMRQAIQQDLGVAEVVKIITLDPALTGKLIQVVNSPLYRSQDPISSCLNAVNRLGLTATRNLVTAMCLKNLVNSGQPSIKKRIHEVWVHSIRVSSISYILAKLTHQVDPEEALLAGLLHNIGSLPILMFAATLPETAYQPEDIDACINALQGQVGTFVLNKWDFPEKLRQIPLHSENWFANSGSQLDLNDIVLLAKFHHLLALPSKPVLPFISSLPAFQKLGNQPLTPEMSLHVLQDAKQQINEAMGLFAA